MVYNSLITVLVLSAEFTSFASRRQSLRVTSPRGRQRSTYWLSLPYRFSLPLLISSTLLNWLISQTIYVVVIKVNDPGGAFDAAASVNGLGWSAQGLVASICLSFAMLVYPIALGCKRFDAGAPIVGSNSLAIRAACCTLPGVVGEGRQALKYGYIGLDVKGNGIVGFSSGSVRRLGKGYVFGQK